MTVLPWPESRARAVARALHPSNPAARAARTPAGGRPPPGSGPGRAPGGTVAVLWDEHACRDRLRSASHGSLVYGSGPGQSRAEVVCVVEGAEILLILPRAAAGAGREAHGQDGTLDVVGVTPDRQAWLIRAVGRVEAFFSTETQTGVTPSRRTAVGLLDRCDYALLSLTATSLRGYQLADRR